MDDFVYSEKLNSDLLEQFRGKKNIGVVAASYARQLQEVYSFLMSLLKLLDLDACAGAQLDLIGRLWSSPGMTPACWPESPMRTILTMTCTGNSSSGRYCSTPTAAHIGTSSRASRCSGIRHRLLPDGPEIPATIILSTPPLDLLPTNPRELP